MNIIVYFCDNKGNRLFEEVIIGFGPILNSGTVNTSIIAYKHGHDEYFDDTVQLEFEFKQLDNNYQYDL